jgi:hypothetical protein
MEGKKYTQEDIKEFDKLCDLMDSRDQVSRIKGRLEFAEFEKRFTRAELDEMFEQIKDKYNK